MQAGFLINIILPASLFIIMLGMGLALRLRDFSLIITRPKAVALGVFAQMVMLPLLAYAVVLLFDLQGALAVGLMILSLCPGGMVSNLYTFLARGDIALSVTLTSVVSIIAPFSVPVLIVFFMQLLMGEGQQVELPVLRTILQLVVITLIPITIGMVINAYKRQFAQRAEKYVKRFSMVFLFLIVTSIVIKNIEQMAGYFMQAGVAALTLNLVCMILGYSLAKLAKLNEAQSKTISLEVGLQNGATAIVVALSILNNTEMAIAPTCYSLLMFITGALFVWLLNYKERKSSELVKQ
ncbi:bile acid:sodium symporter family protein [Thalassotalea sp. PLHSN55]|uniref:bile acid:sodium symporter family protein n=1 Tax=Thalassotalea sp. PLHSN55 TaxID=3435888 RepID=UPI003F86BCA3